MDSWSMIMSVRNSLLEFDANPITNELILEKLNFAYTFIYSHIIKSDDSRFGHRIPFTAIAGQTEYELPKEAFGKRIEQIIFPYPATLNTSPLGYQEIKRVDFKEVFKYDVPRIRTWLPDVWSILDNKLYIYPKTITNATAYILLTPPIVPLGITVGQVIAKGASSITLDVQHDTSLTDRLSPAINAFLSVIDYQTGVVKYVMSYNAVNTSTNEITLVAPARTTYLGQALTDPATAGVMADINIDDYVVAGYATALNMFSTEYDQFLINQAVLLIRSSLNENDPETLNAYKENMKQLAGDLAGRAVGIHIKRDFGRNSSYTRPGRGN